MWSTFFVTLFVTVLLTVPIVWLLGWRRPGAPAEESAMLSGIFLFVLLFLTTWALMGWLAPWGPAFFGVSWLMLLVGAAFVALLILVASPVPRGAPATTTGARVTEAVEGIGVIFWILVILLLLVGVVGNTHLPWN